MCGWKLQFYSESHTPPLGTCYSSYYSSALEGKVKLNSYYKVAAARIVDEMQGGARVEVRSEKRHPGDFALWKRAESGHLMRWRDPYSGWGYPGWHTECVVMSTRYLGGI